jgi:outer membrane lipoprotein LolB
MRRFLALGLLVFIAGCTTAPIRMHADAGSLAGQDAREQALRGRDHWTLQARMSVSDGKDGGSSDLTWTQAGDAYDFTVRAVGKAVRLHGDAAGAVLEGLDGGPVRGADAEALMAKALGWKVPLSELRAWILGLRAGGSSAELTFGADGLPGQLLQDGWTVNYLEWDTTQRPGLPTKVFAERTPYKVRLAKMSWTFL